MQPIIIDNFLTEEELNFYADSAKKQFFLYSDNTGKVDNVGGFSDNNTHEHPLFVHSAVFEGNIDSDYFKPLIPLVEKFANKVGKSGTLYRARVNLSLPFAGYPEGKYVGPHYDAKHLKSMNCIYYLNDADGDTIFFESEERDENGNFKIAQTVTPKKNRLVMYDGDTMHSNFPPRTSKERWVINLIFIPGGYERNE